MNDRGMGKPGAMTIAGICELVLETDDVERLQGFYEELGLRRLLTEDADRVWLQAGDRCRLGIWSPAYFFDPAGNRVEIWDFFRDGDGAEDGVMALADGDGHGA